MKENPPRLLGTVIQRFNIRRGVAARPYRDNIQEIKQSVVAGLVPALRSAGMVMEEAEYGQELVGNGLCLAEIPDFQGLLPKALEAGVPVYELSDTEIGETGVVLEGMQRNRERCRDLFEHISEEVRRLTVR